MKKVLRILLITIGVILLLLILTPILFKSKIETTVKEKINESIHATVDWSRFSLSLFRGFPDLSINLHQVSVVGVEPFAGDTLVGLKRFEFRVNPFSAIRKDMLVKSVLLDHPLINGIVLEDGAANWDITEAVVEEPEEALEEEPGEGSSMSVSLEKFAIQSGRIYYKDAAMGAEAAMEDFNLELAGDFSMEETELKLSIDVKGIDARYGGIRYMKKGSFGLDLLAAANMVENRYTMLENEIRINGLILGTEGEVFMMDDGGMDMDLRFFTRETTFQTLLSMVPAIYLSDFESLKASGSLLLEGEVKGVMRDSIMPDVLVKLEVTDGFFSYPDLPKDVSDVQLSLLVDYNGKDMDLTTVDLEQFHLSLGGNPFDATLHVNHPVSDMQVKGELKGLIDFNTLKDVVPMEVMDLEGRLTADVRVNTRMSYIEKEDYEEVDLDGLIMVEGVTVESPDIPVPVELRKLELIFNPRYVDLTGVDLQMGDSDLYLEGALSNFIPYVFKGKTVSGGLKVSSLLLDADELMSENEMEAIAEKDLETEEDILSEEIQDSLAVPVQMKIPENIDFKLDLDLKKVIYDGIEIENILGEVNVSKGVAELSGLQMDLIGGRVTASGAVDTKDEFARADLSLDMLGVDIPMAYSSFVAVERLAPMAKYCKGSANISLKYSSMLDAGFSPLYESIDANGQVFTKNLQVYNTKSFVRLSELLKNEKFKEMTPNDMNIKFRVRDGNVIVDPFDMKYDDSKITVSGLHGIDMSLDYLLDMKIAKADMGAGVNDMMDGISALAAGVGIGIPESDYVKVKAKVTGTFNDPKVSTDLSGNLESGKTVVKEALEERVVDEIKQVEEEVREEASEKADEIIEEAEAEAEKIMEGAREAGEELVKEATKQGEDLVEEAGSNPLKKLAARKLADEMVFQAEKQSEKLLQEAQLKADELMENARAEADRI